MHMPAQIETGRRANLLGSLWMVASMAAFAVEDAFLKTASQSLPVAQVLVVFGLGGMFVFGALAVARNERILAPAAFSKAMRIRMLFEVTARLFYVLALAYTPLSSATLILQATPLIVVAGAALVFGERVGWRRWAAIATGLLGVLVILQPGGESFSPLSVLALIGMLCFAARDLASRVAPASLGTAVLGVYGFFSVLLAGLLHALWSGEPFRWPEAGAAGLALPGAVLAGVMGYGCLMKAMRTGEVSAVTPFRYSRLLFGSALGLAIFGEVFTLTMLIGSCLIVLSGLFILIRGRAPAD